MQIIPVHNSIRLNQHYRKPINKIYIVEHEGDAQYIGDSITACYKWIALKLGIPEEDITLNQVIQAGYRIKVT